MKFYTAYDQKNWDEVLNLVQSESTCNLITLDPEGLPNIGIFNPIYRDGKLYLHLNRTDTQVADIQSGSPVTLTMQEILAVIPSYWVDEKYGGAATTYYRYAEFTCAGRVIDDPEEMISFLKGFMDHYQGEGHYDEIKADSPVYVNSLKAICILELSITKWKAKWKIGQNRPVETRRKVIEQLKKRGLPADLRAVEEIEKWIKTECGPLSSG